MPRHTDSDLRKDWKISLPATLAGAVEFELLDPLTKKPRYAERSRLIAALLAAWLQARGKAVEVDMPSADLYTPPPKPKVLNGPDYTVSDPSVNVTARDEPTT